MERILTGLQPTGNLTIGNYIGSIKQMIELEDKMDSFLFVADLHAITIPQDPNKLHEQIKKNIAMYIACGINPDKHTIYIQSENEYIPGMSWLLECSTYYGEASRMIQFKEKSKKNENFTLGLLTYPVLMTADILYCDTKYVPVGLDQKQHVELARDIAVRFNKKYGDTFVVPEYYEAKIGKKIQDLKDPNVKMSKSAENPAGVIYLFDTPEDAKNKIMKATTDSLGEVKYDPENQAGISNLLTIASVLDNKAIDEIVDNFKDKGYGEFKNYVGDVVANFLREIQMRFNEIIESDVLDRILDKGIIRSRELAKEKYEIMKEKMGVTR